MPSTTSSAIIGPGAIGAAIAGAILMAGGEPRVCARTAFDNLTVDHPNGSITSPVACTTDPAQVQPVDTVILAVKAHQTNGAAPWLRALTGPETVVVIAQNGVEHLERVQPHVHPECMLVPAVIWCPSRRLAPGHVHVTGQARLTVPVGDGADRLSSLVANSFFEIRASSDWLSRAWDKLLLNSALGGAGVLTGRAGSDLTQDPAMRELLSALMAEAVLVGRAGGGVDPRW